MTVSLEIFVEHVTELELATRLEVSIGSPCLQTFLSFIRTHTWRLVSDYCEQERRFCAITPISSAPDLQLPSRVDLHFTRPILGVSSLPAGRLPPYGPRSTRVLLRLCIPSLTPGMEILFSVSTLRPFICELLTFDSRWVDDPPSSVCTIRGRIGLASRAISINLENRDVV